MQIYSKRGNQMARPPGKKNIQYSLSVEQKALTALSLVFAIFRLTPRHLFVGWSWNAPLWMTPTWDGFVISVQIIQKLCSCIYITHNKIAMKCNTLEGVTNVANQGVSRMVSVRCRGSSGNCPGWWWIIIKGVCCLNGECVFVGYWPV